MCVVFVCKDCHKSQTNKPLIIGRCDKCWDVYSKAILKLDPDRKPYSYDSDPVIRVPKMKIFR